MVSYPSQEERVVLRAQYEEALEREKIALDYEAQIDEMTRQLAEAKGVIEATGQALIERNAALAQVERLREALERLALLKEDIPDEMADNKFVFDVPVWLIRQVREDLESALSAAPADSARTWAGAKWLDEFCRVGRHSECMAPDCSCECHADTARADNEPEFVGRSPVDKFIRGIDPAYLAALEAEHDEVGIRGEELEARWAAVEAAKKEGGR